MAIVKSIAIGKARGSAGDVTFAIVNGQQIAKQKVPKKGSIAPVNQSVSQIQMGNFVRAWQFLSVFFSFAFKLAKPTESIYNAIARFCKSGMSEVLNNVRQSCALELLALNSIPGNWGSVTDFATDGTSMDVLFASNGLPFVADLHVRSISFNSASGANVIVDRAVTEMEWNAGELTLVNATALGHTTAAAYLYSTDKSKISNVFSTEI